MTLQITNATDIKATKGTYLIYGPPGMGKTYSAKFFPGKTLILDVDRTSRVLKGEKNIDIAKINNADTWEHWEEVISELSKNYVGKYDNIVVDNISELERRKENENYQGLLEAMDEAKLEKELIAIRLDKLYNEQSNLRAICRLEGQE